MAERDLQQTLTQLNSTMVSLEATMRGQGLAGAGSATGAPVGRGAPSPGQTSTASLGQQSRASAGGIVGDFAQMRDQAQAIRAGAQAYQQARAGSTTTGEDGTETYTPGANRGAALKIASQKINQINQQSAPSATAGQSLSTAPMGAQVGGGGGGGMQGGGGGQGGGQGGYAGAESAGGGLVNRLMGKASKTPGVGALIGAVAKPLGEFRSQRAKTDYYRSMTGDSTSDAIGDRFAEERERFANFAYLDQEENARAFKGLTAMGYRDDPSGRATRGDAMDFIVRNKRDSAMSDRESMAMLDDSMLQATGNLSELSKELENVSKSANKAQINTMKARKQFDSYVSAALDMGAGSNAVAIGSRMEQSNTRLGKAFENVDSSAQTQFPYRYMLASRAGVSVNEIQAMETQDPVAFGKIQDELRGSTIEGQFSPEQMQWLKQQVDSYGDGLDDQASMEIAERFWQTQTDGGSPNPEAFLQVYTQFSGKTFNDHVQALANYIMQDIGGYNEASNARDSVMKSAPTDLSGERADGSKMKSLGSLNQGGKSGATEGYQRRAKALGSRSQVLESYLRETDNPDEDKQKYEVYTEDGKRVVSAEEAFEKFPNQLATGQARLVGGEDKGKSFTDANKLTKDRSKAAVEGAENERGRNSSAGQDADKYYAKNPKDRAETGGPTGSREVVKIDLSDDARRFFKVTDQYEEDANGEPRRRKRAGSRQESIQDYYSQRDPRAGAQPSSSYGNR